MVVYTGLAQRTANEYVEACKDTAFVARFWTRVLKSDGCWNWTGSTFTDSARGGYGLLVRNGSKFVAHRVSFVLHGGILQDDLVVCHHCDNPRCVRPEHLFLGSTRDNHIDAVSKGRKAAFPAPRRGVSNPRCKLTDEDVLIIASTPGGSVTAEVARAYGISVSHVTDIRKGKKRGDVTRQHAILFDEAKAVPR